MWNDHLKKADISFSSSGDNTVIAGVPGKRIAIDVVVVRAEGGATTVQMKDGTVAYGGAHGLDRHEGFSYDNVMRNQDGIITLSEGQGFIINSTNAVQVSGLVRYRWLNES